MLHPSYTDLMNRINDGKEEVDQLRSRYSIVIASSKRARQLVDGDPPLIKKEARSLSTAVKEIYEGKIEVV